MMFVHDSEKFHVAVACIELWMALAWLRVAMALPRCKGIAFYFFAVLVATAVLTLFCGMNGMDGSGLDWLPLFVQPVTSVIFAYGAPHHMDIPMNIDYHIPKFAGMGSLVMGQLVGAAGMAPRSNLDGGPADPTHFYGGVLAAVLMIISFKLIYLDCDTTLTQNHAIRTSKTAALSWLLFAQPARNLSVASCAAGLQILLDVKNRGSQDSSRGPFGMALFSYAAACIFVAALVAERQHKVEEVVAKSKALRAHKSAWYGALALSALSCASLPWLRSVDSALQVILTVAFLATATAGVGLAGKSALLKKRAAAASSGGEAKPANKQAGGKEGAKKDN